MISSSVDAVNIKKKKNIWFVCGCSYVLASYAKYLWDAGEEEEEENDDDEQEDYGISGTLKCTSLANVSRGCPPTPVLAAPPPA
jgi:hypothetical protein